MRSRLYTIAPKIETKSVVYIKALNLIEQTVSAYFSNPYYSKYCMCSICMYQYELVEKGKELFRQSSSIFKLYSQKYRRFFELMSCVVKGKIFFRLFIPEMCFFENGYGRYLFQSKKGFIYMTLLSSYSRMTIANHFINNRKLKINSKEFSETSKDNHIKYFNYVIPSYKHGLSNNNLSNYPKNYIFHCCKKVSYDNNEIIRNKNFIDLIAVVKYKDRGFELITEKQLRNLIKLSPKQSQIDFIQSYIKPHEKYSQLLITYYLSDHKPANYLMYERSLVHIKVEIGLLSKFSKGYISLYALEDYENLLKDIPSEYCLYETYKMVHYMYINRDVKVERLNTVWLRDEYMEICFFGVLQFEYEQNEIVVVQGSQLNYLKELLTGYYTELEGYLLEAWYNMKKRKMIPYPKRKRSEYELEIAAYIAKIKEESELRRKKYTARKRNKAK